jgi:PKD repeat protein
VGCHWDADPANYTPVGEEVVPSYYGSTADTLADNPINDVAQFQINENWTVGDFVGLDNDGDQVYDAADTGNQPPSADHGGPYTGEVNIPVAFDGSLSSDLDGTIVLYEWTFGDSGTATGATPTHTYTAEGAYTVTLTVTDDLGATDMATTNAGIGVATPAPPVNQSIGMVDQTTGTMVEADCRACHTAPPPPERHHNLYGQTIPPGSVVPEPDADGDTVPDTNYTCLNCHLQDGDGNFRVERDCVVCHTSNAHHGTADATGGTCTTCHGDIVDDMTDGHYVPSYDPSLVTPIRSGGTGLPLNHNGHGTGGCDYCHNDDGLPTPIIDTNRNLHHGTGLDVGNCTWCHDTGTGPSGADDGWQMRICEGCHGPQSLHNVQADSSNAGNIGSIVVGGEDAGYGHVGRDAGPGDSDCWGCHGFAIASDGGPDTSALVPTVYGCEPSTITAGTDATVLVVGSAFTNTTGNNEYRSDVVLTAADGSTLTLTPDAIDAGAMEFTIPGDTPPGGYRLRAIKIDDSGNPVASSPVNLSIRPQVLITDASFKDSAVTITGRGFGGYAEGSGTSVTGTIKVGNRNVSVEGTIISWSDTMIVAGFDSRPIDVTVHSVFGSSAPEVVVKIKRGRGGRRN